MDTHSVIKVLFCGAATDFLQPTTANNKYAQYTLRTKEKSFLATHTEVQ